MYVTPWFRQTTLPQLSQHSRPVPYLTTNHNPIPIPIPNPNPNPNPNQKYKAYPAGMAPKKSISLRFKYRLRFRDYRFLTQRTCPKSRTGTGRTSCQSLGLVGRRWPFESPVLFRKNASTTPCVATRPPPPTSSSPRGAATMVGVWVRVRFRGKARSGSDLVWIDVQGCNLTTNDRQKQVPTCPALRASPPRRSDFRGVFRFPTIVDYRR